VVKFTPCRVIATAAVIVVACWSTPWAVLADPAPLYPYQDVTKSAAVRAADLAARMTVAEKIQQLNNTAPAIPRLGIPRWEYWNEALHGILDSNSTSFPVPASFGSSWDTSLLYQIGSAISDEARIKYVLNKHGLDYWCPDINIERDPRWGRNEEVYGEDPYQMSQLVAPFIKGMQGDNPRYLKTIATPKHFVANTTEYDRNSVSETVDERSLHEYYLPPFRAAIVDGKADSIMAAYNAVNGIPMVCSADLLTGLLRKQWGFTGYVVSDCGAVQDVYYNHKYVNDTGLAAALTIKAGMDMCCGNFTGWLTDAYNRGLVTEADLNHRVAEVMEARIRLGSLDPDSDCPYNSIPASKLCSPELRRLALKAAEEGIVLLKNEHNLLPLNKNKVRTIAIIGPNANRCILGGYSGSPRYTVTPLQGISTELGVSLSDPMIDASTAVAPDDLQFQPSSEGFQNLGFIRSGSYAEYKNIDLTGKTSIAFRVASPNAPASPIVGVGLDADGKPATGAIEVHLDSLDAAAAATVPVPSTGDWQTWTTVGAAIRRISGKHNVFLKFIGPDEPFNLEWFEPLPASNPPSTATRLTFDSGGASVWGTTIDTDRLNAAVAAAKHADVAVLFVGTDKDRGSVGEGQDRSSLGMPGTQEQLIKAVYAANPRTVVVLINGYSLAIDWEQQHIPAIVNAWYGGQEQGTAIAHVLFGDYNPGGKLAQTWFSSTKDLPDFHDNDVTHNRTYMYFKGKPLYPFGFGLSYTSFGYSDLSLSRAKLLAGDSLTVTAKITNTGKVAGDEISQLYVEFPQLKVATPIKELKGFSRIHLDPGKSKVVTFSVPYSNLTYWDVDLHKFVVKPGIYKFLVGKSSVELPLSRSVSVL
jgi:beta-glucosidase